MYNLTRADVLCDYVRLGVAFVLRCCGVGEYTSPSCDGLTWSGVVSVMSSFQSFMLCFAFTSQL